MNPFAELLSLITWHPREKVDIQWSKDSWTINLFRLWELVFWRRQGIKAEQMTLNDGTVICYSWENKIVYAEYLFRQWLKKHFGYAYAPILQFQGVIPAQGLYPRGYVFAIAFDAVGGPGAGTRGGTSISFNHTCTGSNVVLTCGVTFWNAGSADPTGVTFNSSAMTKVKSFTFAAGAVDETMWLQTIGTGSGTALSVAVTLPTGANNGSAAGSISMSGCNQTQTGATGTGTATSTAPSVAITTNKANSWVVDVIGINSTLAGASPSANLPTTSRWQQNLDATTGTSSVGGTTTTTTAGSNPTSWTIVSNLWGGCGVEVQPFSGGATTTFLSILGAGT